MLIWPAVWFGLVSQRTSKRLLANSTLKAIAQMANRLGDGIASFSFMIYYPVLLFGVLPGFDSHPR